MTDTPGLSETACGWCGADLEFEGREYCTETCLDLRLRTVNQAIDDYLGDRPRNQGAPDPWLRDTTTEGFRIRG